MIGLMVGWSDSDYNAAQHSLGLGLAELGNNIMIYKSFRLDLMCIGMHVKLVKIIQIREDNFKDFDSSSFYDIEICLFYTSRGFFQFSAFHG